MSAATPAFDLAQLWTDHHAALLKRARAHGLNHHDAQDQVSDLFHDLTRCASRLLPPPIVYPWLCRRLLWRIISSKTRAAPACLNLDDIPEPTHEHTPASALHLAEIRAALHQHQLTEENLCPVKTNTRQRVAAHRLRKKAALLLHHFQH